MNDLIAAAAVGLAVAEAVNVMLVAEIVVHAEMKVNVKVVAAAAAVAEGQTALALLEHIVCICYDRLNWYRCLPCTERKDDCNQCWHNGYHLKH